MNFERAKKVLENAYDRDVINSCQRRVILDLLDALAEPESDAKRQAETTLPSELKCLFLDDVAGELDHHGGGFHVHIMQKYPRKYLGVFDANGFHLSENAEEFVISKERSSCGGAISPPDEGGYGIVIKKKIKG